MGSSMKVAIIGALRRNNGIGPYIARYCALGGSEVVGVLGTTAESSAEAASNLVQYGIHARAFTDFHAMVNESRPDAVVIASPTRTHLQYVELCIEAGRHVFCEKPFLSPEREDAPEVVSRLMDKARSRNLVVGMNSQWPFCLGAYEELCGRIDPSRVESFSMRLSPLSAGREMIPDSVPHALSLLYCILGPGAVEGLSFEKGGDSLRIQFAYASPLSACSVSIGLVREVSQPRTFSFGFNGRVAGRSIDLASYTIYLTCGDKILKIADPLELSVRDYLAAAEQGREPLLGMRHIMDTAPALQQIYAGYGE